MRALLVYPTHANIREELEAYAEMGIDAAPYPPRTTVDTDHILQNCWNEQADRAEKDRVPGRQNHLPDVFSQRDVPGRRIPGANDSSQGGRRRTGHAPASGPYGFR